MGRIDGVVLEISDKDWHLGLDYYLLNIVRMTRLVTPIMDAQGGGSIVNISTVAAFEPDPDFPTSAVFRAGLTDFTKLFSTKYAARNIRMNNVLPGFIDSLPEPQRLMSGVRREPTMGRRQPALDHKNWSAVDLEIVLKALAI